MKTEIADYIVKTTQFEWTPLVEENVDTKGIYVKVLRYDEQQQRAPVIILKFEPGASYPYHNHPGGEEIFVLWGSCAINNTELYAGDYLYTPPGFKHDVSSPGGCELLLLIPEEVAILEK